MCRTAPKFVKTPRIEEPRASSTSFTTHLRSTSAGYKPTSRDTRQAVMKTSTFEAPHSIGADCLRPMFGFLSPENSAEQKDLISTYLGNERLFQLLSMPCDGLSCHHMYSDLTSEALRRILSPITSFATVDFRFSHAVLLCNRKVEEHSGRGLAWMWPSSLAMTTHCMISPTIPLTFVFSQISIWKTGACICQLFASLKLTFSIDPIQLDHFSHAHSSLVSTSHWKTNKPYFWRKYHPPSCLTIFANYLRALPWRII